MNPQQTSQFAIEDERLRRQNRLRLLREQLRLHQLPPSYDSVPPPTYEQSLMARQQAIVSLGMEQQQHQQQQQQHRQQPNDVSNSEQGRRDFDRAMWRVFTFYIVGGIVALLIVILIIVFLSRKSAN